MFVNALPNSDAEYVGDRQMEKSKVVLSPSCKARSNVVVMAATNRPLTLVGFNHNKYRCCLCQVLM
jgi:hypothetical protein